MEDTKQRILEKSLELFSTKGYDAVSVGEIAKAVGIKAPSLYNHFPSKQAIFDAILETTSAHYQKDTFTCKVCGRVCTPQNAGSDHRNHCPNCLSSLHVDEEPGDRASDCGGIMEPVAVWVRKGGEWAIIHRCKRCGKLSSNRVAADDNPMKLMSIAMKPLCSPPFPLDYIEEMTALMGGDGRMR